MQQKKRNQENNFIYKSSR